MVPVQILLEQDKPVKRIHQINLATELIHFGWLKALPGTNRKTQSNFLSKGLFWTKVGPSIRLEKPEMISFSSFYTLQGAIIRNLWKFAQ